jgi:phospholipid/cholesterol/gamma-HCH transport system substrate-binding protein
METRANYVAVGAFVLACIVGLMVTVVWLAGIQYSQEFVYYQTFLTGPVTGLGKGTTVRYNGIEVGRVDDLAFDPDDPQKTIVTMEVKPGLNIREDSQASIETQGLTGGSYVEISGGTAGSPLLTVKPGQRYPVIQAAPSTLMQLEESAPKLLAKLNVAADRLNDILSDRNRKDITGILDNLNTLSGTFSRRSGDIDKTLKNVGDASVELKPVLADADTTLKSANVSVEKIGKLANDADALVSGPTFSQVGELIADLKKMSVSLTKLSDQLNREPTKLLFGDRRKGYSPK